jgi:excisionase family DNA binding protein
MSRYAKINEACEYGRFGLTKCYKLINKEKIDAVKDGKTTLVDLDSIDRYQQTLPKFMSGSKVAVKKTPKKASKETVRKHER